MSIDSKVKYNHIRIKCTPKCFALKLKPSQMGSLILAALGYLFITK